MRETPDKARPMSDHEARAERGVRRRAEIEPLLVGLTAHADGVYDVLRPKAKHVLEVTPDHPLRHQQISGLINGRPARLLADYLMIGFGNHHTLILHRHFGETQVTQTKIERWVMQDLLLAERTLVKQFAKPKSFYGDEGLMNMESSTFCFPEIVGHNGMFVADTCAWPEFENAETLVHSIELELDEAIARYAQD